MGPLLLFSTIAIAISIERARFWYRITRRQRSVVKNFLRTYHSDRFAGYEQLKQHNDLPIARIFLEALELDGASPSQFHLGLQGATQAEIPLLRRFGTMFQTIVAVAPLFGLLGTILGLIRSFSAIRLGDIGGDATGVTGGIGEALVSTAVGLFVAIFTLMFANLFRGLYRRQIAMIQEYGSQLEILYEWHYDKQNDSHRSEESYEPLG